MDSSTHKRRGGQQLGRPAGTVTAEDIAEAFGVMSTTVSAWAKAGKIPQPAMKVGRKWFWRDGVIEECARRFESAVSHIGTHGGAA